VGHRDGGHLVRDGDRPRRGLALRIALGVGLDQRREVRPGVGEEVFDAARGKQLQIGLGGALDCRSLQHRWLSFDLVW
jgi:hypothetical protein